MYYYKARIYAPKLGRFLQTDPIGYEDDINLYAYVGNDPLNGIDPTGTSCGTRIPGHNAANCKSYGAPPKTDTTFVPETRTTSWIIPNSGPSGEAAASASEAILYDPNISPDTKVAIAATAGTSIVPAGWVARLTAWGARFLRLSSAAKSAPKSWTAARNAYWKQYGPGGKAPTREVLVRDTRTGQVYRRTETKELHHIDPQRAGGRHDPSNLREAWPTEHAALDPHRHPGYEVIRVFSE